MTNSNHYQSIQHRDHVITCIKNRYDRIQKQKAVERFAKTKYSRDMISMFDLFSIKYS